MVDGNRGAIPVFTKKEDKIIGGFSFIDIGLYQ